MRWTRTFIPTKKETPEGAEIPSHVFMTRAGLIAQVMAGAYTYLPLGLRSLQKAADIVRQEMDQAGAVELLMSAMSPQSLWEQTGRVEAFGNVLVKLTLPRRDRKVPVVLGPTHEEIITDLVSRHISSYRQMPVTFYQIQTKFRNEERPRFGVLRTSEFLMKDAYSFNASLDSLNRSYDAMYEAYCKIFTRCGVPFLIVEAESGPIGGDASHEFMIPSPNGEDSVVHCPACRYAANLEKAEIGAQDTVPPEAPLEPVTEVPTPGATTIDQVSAMLEVAPTSMIKTLIYVVDGRPVGVMVRGDHDANENKIRRRLGAESVELAPPEVIQQVTGAPVGFAGPVGLAQRIDLVADRAVAAIRNGVAGANKAETHVRGVNPDRDLTDMQYADLRNAGQGDSCPRCASTMDLHHAIEVGHVFKLGTKYSEALGARFLDAEEQLHPIIMGCYGIGVNRILAGLIETSHDENGIIWPVSIAPYEVLVVPLKVKDEASMEMARQLEAEFTALGIDVLIDDRDARAGVKFNDADLIGIPLRIVLGPKSLADGKLEVKWRWEDEPRLVDVEGAVPHLAAELDEERHSCRRLNEARHSDA